MVGGDAVDHTVGQGLDQSVNVPLGAQRRIYLGAGVVGQSAGRNGGLALAAHYPLFGGCQVVRADFGRHRKTPLLGLAHQGHAAGGAEVGDMEPSAGGLGQGDVSGDHRLFRRGGDAVQAQVRRHRAFGHDSVARQRKVLAMVADGQAQVQAVDQRQTHQVGVVYRVAVVAEGHHAGAGQLFHLGKLVTLPPLGDTSDGQDTHHRISAGPLMDEFDHRGVVDGRVGVGHGAEGGETAFGRGPGTGGDGLFVLKARLAKMTVQVDKARAGHQTGAVDDPAAVGYAVRSQSSGGQNLPAANQ